MLGCFLVPRFPLACELAGRPELAGQTVAVVNHLGKVVAASREAEKAGVAPDQLQREALARCPLLAVLEARPSHYQTRHRELVSALSGIAYTLDPQDEGVIFFDLGELLPLYASAHDLLVALLDSCDSTLGPRVGVAPSRFAAQTAAMEAEPHSWRVVEESHLLAFLARQPISDLPLSIAAREHLHRLGMRTLGRLQAIPRSALISQLGREGKQAWELIQGQDRVMRPQFHREPVRQQISLEAPLSTLESLLAMCEQALNRVLSQPQMRGQAARQARLRLVTENGGNLERRITFKTASSERAQIWPLLRETMKNLRLPGPVSSLELELASLTPAEGQQLSWSKAGVGEERLKEAIRQLKARYGACPVSRVVEVELWNRIPERRLALIDFDP